MTMKNDNIFDINNNILVMEPIAAINIGDIAINFLNKSTIFTASDSKYHVMIITDNMKINKIFLKLSLQA